jgi:GWxTD domain-containing protein
MRLAWPFAKSSVLCVLVATTPVARAQNALLRPDSVLLTLADSLDEIRRLTDHVRANGRDAAAWHRRGMLVSGVAERARTPPPIKGLDHTLLLRDADTSLRIAAQLESSHPTYYLSVGDFLLRSDNAMTRSAARGFYARGLESARRSKDRTLIAQTALFYGRTMWWQYDVMANRHVATTTLRVPRSVTQAMRPVDDKSIDVLDWIQRAQLAGEVAAAERGRPGELVRVTPGDADRILAGTGPDGQNSSAMTTSMKGARELLEANTRRLSMDVAGASQFLMAHDAFYEAYEASPAYPGTFRSVAMVLADRKLWRGLMVHAQHHLDQFPNDPIAHMALGLAYQREQSDAGATAAFEKWLDLVGPHERTRLDNMSRVLPPDSATSLGEPGTPERIARERSYWALANVMWSDSVRLARTEFLARVAYAELRWTNEEVRLSGADSDRGDIYVRYGPPDDILVFGGVAGESADITTYWMYDSGLMFAFNGMPTFGSARIARDDEQMVQSLRSALPVRWDNVPRPIIDSIPARVARFRASRDALDVVIAARLPAPDSIRASMSIMADVQRRFWLKTDMLEQLATSSARLDSAGVQSWTTRITPHDLVYRVEAFGETASRAGVASGLILASTSDFPLHGRGISDVLVAQRIDAAPSLGSRWQELRPVPIAGSVKAGQAISLVWENYEFPSDSATVAYEVTITLERQRTAGGRLAAQLVGALAAAARVDRNDDRMVITYDRVGPPSAAFADYITVNLGDTPAGTYKVIVAVRDKARGAVATRTVSLEIRE